MRIIKTFALKVVLCGSLASVPVSQVSCRNPDTRRRGQSTIRYNPCLRRTDDFDRFVASLVTTFGGTTSKEGEFTVTPTPSLTMSQLVLTPVGTLSIFGFKTPIPYPFGAERTGYLVTDIDAAVRASRAHGAAVRSRHSPTRSAATPSSNGPAASPCSSTGTSPRPPIRRSNRSRDRVYLSADIGRCLHPRLRHVRHGRSFPTTATLPASRSADRPIPIDGCASNPTSVR